MNHDEHLKEELIQSWLQIYQHNQSYFNIINQFERNYNNNLAIWWYSRDGCIYSTLNDSPLFWGPSGTTLRFFVWYYVSIYCIGSFFFSNL
jgi:hypothetical protein